MPFNETKALSIATTAIKTATEVAGSAIAAGLGVYHLFHCLFTRGAASNATGITFRVKGSQDGLTWITLPTYKASDTTKTVAASQAVTAGQAASAVEGLICDAARAFPRLQVTAQSGASDGTTGDLVVVYLEQQL